MTRRRADRPLPCAGVALEALTEAERHAVQDAIAERYHGRKDREAWDRRYWRGRKGQIFMRGVRVPTGSARGSAVWRK